MKILISDCHAGCQIWQSALLETLGHEVVINSFSGHAFILPERLKANITPDVSRTSENPELSDKDIQNVSAFDTLIVSFPPSFINLYDKAPTNFKKILNCGHRLHICSKKDPLFVEKLLRKVEIGEIVLCSMSKYDTEYIKHYTNITPLELYMTASHINTNIVRNPTRQEVLISPVHASNVLPFDSIHQMNVTASNMDYNLHFAGIKQLYGNYNYEDLMNHKATVMFPYSAFSISMVELYEMNIPMFVPSDELIIQTGLMNDVSIFPCYGTEEYMQSIDIPHKDSPHSYSPNSTNYDDKLYWIKFAYFNTKKNIIRWNSPKDLFEKLTTINLYEVSENMRIENQIHREKQLENWRSVLKIIN